MSILRHKNQMIRREREKMLAEEWTNRILSTYLALLIDREGEVRVPQELIASNLGKYSSAVKRVGDDYLIKVTCRENGRLDGKK